ncbi:Protein BIG GRAIN 1-like A [Senna tora]|uniref:Protein BIG GRAIN 1-like A n=1 Tax=Senna tora TaxID=362788 RepID=A0A834U430_9FABA|nr:Protein BIG GRAIN 1-like A [Senna tora]
MTKIRDSHVEGIVQEDVAGLEVTVNDLGLLFVQILHSLGYLQTLAHPVFQSRKWDRSVWASLARPVKPILEGGAQHPVGRGVVGASTTCLGLILLDLEDWRDRVGVGVDTIILCGFSRLSLYLCEERVEEIGEPPTWRNGLLHLLEIIVNLEGSGFGLDQTILVKQIPLFTKGSAVCPLFLVQHGGPHVLRPGGCETGRAFVPGLGFVDGAVNLIE